MRRHMRTCDEPFTTASVREKIKKFSKTCRLSLELHEESSLRDWMAGREGPHQLKQSAPCSVEENKTSEIEVNVHATEKNLGIKSGILLSRTTILSMCLEYLSLKKFTSNFAMLF